MTDDAFIHWLAQELTAVLVTPITGERRLQTGRAFISTLTVKLAAVSDPDRSIITNLLNTWLQTKSIDGYTIPSDDETMDWLEEIVGTVEGITEEGA